MSETLLRFGRRIAVDARSVRDDDNGRIPDVEEDFFSVWEENRWTDTGLDVGED